MISTWTAHLAVAACLLSGTAFAYEDVDSSLERLTLLDLSGRLTSGHRIGPDRLDLALGTEEPIQQDGVAAPSVGSYVKNFIPDLWGGTKRIFYRDNAPLVLIGMGLTGLAYTVDNRVQDYFQEKKPMEHPANIGDKVGAGYFPVGVGLALLGAGEWLDDKKMADTGVITLEALLVTLIATEGLKYATHRNRPDGSDHLSFPSGHASSTASLAASVSAMYDWDLKIAVPLYTITAFVGASRIQANEHYLSDVVAGITLGTVVGSSFAKHQKEKDLERGSATNIAVVPVLDGSCKGIVFNWKF